MTIRSDIEQQAAQDLAVQFERDKLQRAMRHYRSELAKASDQIERLSGQLDRALAFDGVTVTPPRWLAPKPGGGKQHVGIANLLLSDLHLDEIVDPAQIDWLNAYNRKIAELRLRRCFERFVMVGRDFLKGVAYDGAFVWLGGDMFSGNIHEELKETNEQPILAAVDHWIDPMVAGLTLVADAYGKVHLPGVVGNHGRLTRKPSAKNRVKDNYDWFFYRQLWRALKDDRRFTFNIPESADVLVTQYDTRFLFTHGDQFRGGSGIAGMLSPIMLGDSRKRKRQLAASKPYDLMLMGHWHSYFAGRGLIVNGSLKGYDEYAYVSNFDFERPQQAFWVTTPQHGVTFSAPILVEDRKGEGW